jgi:hypothetical protein
MLRNAAHAPISSNTVVTSIRVMRRIGTYPKTVI